MSDSGTPELTGGPPPEASAPPDGNMPPEAEPLAPYRPRPIGGRGQTEGLISDTRLDSPPIQPPQPPVIHARPVVRAKKRSKTGMVLAALFAAAMVVTFADRDVPSGFQSPAEIVNEDANYGPEPEVVITGEYDQVLVDPTRFLNEAGQKAAQKSPKLAVHLTLRNESNEPVTWKSSQLVLVSHSQEVPHSLTSASLVKGAVLAPSFVVPPRTTKTGWVVIDVEDPDAIDTVEWAQGYLVDLR